MKKVIILLLFFPFFQNTFSQNVLLNKEDIIGRWVEVKEINNQIEDIEFPYTYIFRDNDTFHLGEASDGVILFNVAGKYTIHEDVISIIYLDFLKGNAHNRKAKQISLKVLSINSNLMTAMVTDYDYSYKLLLKKQDLTQ
ncbi:MAG: hypothetical protein LBV71_14640 [Prevotella sp.]|nr:hypothetical protein [Prevotella sp.]